MTRSTSSEGYLSREYALSFAEYGTPLELPTAGGWLIKRSIGNSGLSDAMGCYPLFCCKSWAHVGFDLAALGQEIVSVVLVTDPLSDVSDLLLLTHFDKVHLYKNHFVIDTQQPMARFIHKSHRAQAMRALRHVQVERCTQPADYIDDWERLFAILCRRHAISGLRRFSRDALRRQLTTPGMVMFRAVAGGITVGLDLWYVQQDMAQGHLAAFDEAGYRLQASYATKWTMIEYFSNKVSWINLGAGRLADASDGLSAFKRGFSSGTKPAWLCGLILRPRDYDALVCTGGSYPLTDYFPAYRAGEFG